MTQQPTETTEQDDDASVLSSTLKYLMNAVFEPAYGGSTADSQEADKDSIKATVKELWGGDAEHVKHALSKLAVLSSGTKGDEDSDLESREEAHLEKLKFSSDGVRHVGNPNYKQNRKDICKIGGPLAIVKSMEKYPEEANLQAVAIIVLTNLSRNERLHPLLDDVDATEAVMASMVRLPTHLYLQEKGCDYCRSLALQRKLDKEVATETAIAVLVTAMSNHPTDEALQLYACEALHHLAILGEDVATAIIKARGASAVARAAENHRNNMLVRKAALTVLKDTLPCLTGSQREPCEM